MKLPSSESIGFDSDATEFVSLKDGQSVVGIFAGDPIFFRQVWKQGEEKRILPMTASEGARRFRMNFLVKKNGEWSPMILENGPMLYSQIEEENSMRPLEHSVVKLSRKGSGLDTRWDLRFVQEVPEDARGDLAKIKLLDLDPHAGRKEENPPAHGDNDAQSVMTEDDIPF